jgi:putative ABC transport system permease protein
MLRNYVSAALRNLGRNRLYAGITIAGLAVGFAAAMLIGLYVRDELTFDRFVPGHERVYLVTETINLPTAKPIDTKLSQIKLAKLIKADFPEIELAARLSGAYFPPTVRHGDIVTAEQNLYWADRDFFRVMPLPALAGDTATALEAPDSVVITRAVARKYFGRDAPVGQTLLINRQPFRVTAVLKDLPSNTNIAGDIFAASLSPQSPISQFEPINGPLDTTLFTYLRLRPGASPATMEPRVQGFLAERFPLYGQADLGPIRRTLHFLPLTRIHLTPIGQDLYNFKSPVDPAVLAGIGLVGALIVIVAAINFVTLMTARAARRAIEVGVRKAAGASRRDLFWQFMGEAFLYVIAAGLLAVSLAELLMPAFNAFLQRKMAFDYLHDPALALAVLGALLTTAVLAGVYPAVILSGFRPAAVLKGGAVSVGGGRVRTALVVAQFAVLIGLVLVAITIARQTLYALNEGMRLNKDQVLLLLSEPCVEPMRDEVRKLPGVRFAACAGANVLALSHSNDSVAVGPHKLTMARSAMDFDFFSVFGLRPIAGRVFDRARPADGAQGMPANYPPVVINATAVRRLGFASPQAAIGKTIVWHGNWDISLKAPSSVPEVAKPSEIIGVVPDFTLGSMREPIPPSMYAIGRNLPPDSIGMAIKLDRRRLPETLVAIDRLWKRMGEGRPTMRYFVDQLTLRLYVDSIIQGATVAVASLIALSIACLGLFALSAYTTERRTKEIGVRKAMGASSADILRLLLWQFTQPVLWANVLALPVAWLAMDWWLKGFAYHVAVAPWTFAVAAGAAVLIAWSTVFVHALRVSRARPVGALRYE